MEEPCFQMSSAQGMLGYAPNHHSPAASSLPSLFITETMSIHFLWGPGEDDYSIPMLAGMPELIDPAFHYLKRGLRNLLQVRSMAAITVASANLNSRRP